MTFWLLVCVGIGVSVYFVSGRITNTKEPSLTATAIETPIAKTIATSEFSKEVEDASHVIIDVRTPSEYAEGHIQGAKNIDFSADDFTSRIESLPRDASYALYCRSGNRSKKALDVMTSLGFTHVVDMRGGIQAWASEDRGVCREC